MPDSKAGKSTRKCPACGHWSAWNMQPDDRCTHCGEMLDPRAFESRQEREALREKEKYGFRLNLIEIDPAEPLYLRVPKHVLRAIQVSFVAVISFIVWLIVAIAS